LLALLTFQLQITLRKNAPSLFKYLGVQVTPALDQLFKENYNPLLETCKKKLSHCSALPLSLIGKINAIKMSILAKFIYAFNMLPCYIPFSFFKLINTCLTKCIWNNKTQGLICPP
jgi:hypothetical protein